jgi:hypothetical protein
VGIDELMLLSAFLTCSCSQNEQGRKPFQRQAEWSASCVCFLLTQPPNSAIDNALDVQKVVHSYKGAETRCQQAEKAGRKAAAMTLGALSEASRRDPAQSTLQMVRINLLSRCYNLHAFHDTMCVGSM